MKDLIIIGASGFGREVAWAVERQNKVTPTWNLLGFMDDNDEIQDKFKTAQNPLFEVPAGTAAGSDFDIDNAPAPEPMYDENIGEENTAAAELAWN